MKHPTWLRVDDSPWYGKTIFTNKKLYKGHVIAITSVYNYDKHEGHIKTPNGCLFNSTDNIKDVNIKIIIDAIEIKIIAIRDIRKGEELLLKYD